MNRCSYPAVERSELLAKTVMIYADSALLPAHWALFREISCNSAELATAF